jgi:hypothetical protein
MPEKEFWTKYFESLLFHKEKRPQSIVKEENMFTKIAEQQQKEDSEPIVYKEKLKNIDATIDITANEEEYQEVTVHTKTRIYLLSLGLRNS